MAGKVFFLLCLCGALGFLSPDKPKEPESASFVSVGIGMESQSLLEQIASGETISFAQLQGIKDKMTLEQAVDSFEPGQLPSELFTLLRAETEGEQSVSNLISQSPALIDRAIQELLLLIGNITTQVDDLVINDCMPYERSRTAQINSYTDELSHLASLQSRRSGDKMASLNSIQASLNAISGVKTSMLEITAQWDDERAVLDKQKKEADDDATVCKIFINATLPDKKNAMAAQFLLRDVAGIDTGKTNFDLQAVESRNSALYSVCSEDEKTADDEEDMADEATDDFDDEGPGPRELDMQSPESVVPGTSMALIRNKQHSKFHFAISDPYLKNIMDSRLTFAAREEMSRMGIFTSEQLIERASLLSMKAPPASRPSSNSKRGMKKGKCSKDRTGDMMFILHDRAGHMFGRAQDRSDKLATEIATGQNRYQKAMANLVSQINSYQAQIGDSQEAIKKAEADLAQMASQVQQVSLIRWRLIYERHWKKWECRRQLYNLVTVQQCALLKMRDNIVKRFKKLDPLTAVQDCEVSKWIDGPCTVACEGGSRTIYREISTPNNRDGAGCPQISATMVCNTQRCPIDCKVTPWSQWSACSAKCGPGSKDRSREVTRHNRFKGAACPPLQDEAACNMKPCDVDCKLGKWSKWSRCTRACRRFWSYGRMYRVRRVKVHRRGQGQRCAGRHSPVRLQSRRCNPFRCPWGTLRCKAKQDVVIAVDASGDLRNRGFKRIKSFARILAKRYTLGKKKRNSVAIMQFSTTPTILQALTTSKKKVKAATKKLSFEGGLTFTHLAVDRAVKVLQKDGRKTSQNVLVILTTQNPARLVATSNSIKKAKKAGTRVVVVAVGNKRYKSSKKLVSFPVRDNFVRLYSISFLRYRWIRWWYANQVMRITCPRLSPLPWALRRPRCPRGCKRHGRCIKSTGKCKCNKGWKGKKCNKKVKKSTSSSSTR